MSEQQDPAQSLYVEQVVLKNRWLRCFELLARRYGHRVHINALCAHIPMREHGITHADFIAMVEAAGFHITIVDTPLAALLKQKNLPIIAQLHDAAATIIEAMDEERVTIRYPETPEHTVEMHISELEALYAGYAFFIRPRAKVDHHTALPSGHPHTWFWGTIKRNRRAYGHMMIAALMINLFVLASPLFVMNVYDRVIPNAALDTLWALSIGVLIVYLFDFTIKHIRTRLVDVAATRADLSISHDLMAQILGMKLHQRPQSAGILAAKVKEAETLREFFSSSILIALVDFPFILLFLFIIFLIAGPLAYIPALATCAVIVLGVAMQYPLKKLTKEQMAESAAKQALLFETITGLETLKTHRAEGYMLQRWHDLSDRNAHMHYRLRMLSAAIVNITMFIHHLMTVAIVIVGTYLTIDGTLSMGALIAAMILSGRLMAPIGQLVGLLSKFSQSRESLHQLQQLMELEVERPSHKQPITLPDDKGAPYPLEFRNVSLTYPHHTHPALRDVSLLLAPGQKLGVIGAMGAGKSSLIRLAMNFYEPQQGSVLLGGTDIRQLDPTNLRRMIGVVPQDPHIFHGTVRDNIILGNAQLSERAILACAEIAGVLDFLADSELGLDTQVGERGEAISGGQRQTIAIARALLYNPPIIVMDEPSASLDPTAEMRLKQRLTPLLRDKTTMIITHKASMLDLVDEVMLLDKGRMIARDTRDALLTRLQTGEFQPSKEHTP